VLGKAECPVGAGQFEVRGRVTDLRFVGHR
jgi:hypothetical protein